VDDREKELLTGMGNCFAACGADFEGTVEMVAQTRSRSPDEVKATLARMKAEFSELEDYQRLRRRLPSSFPL
jgi:hypothetical protein